MEIKQVELFRLLNWAVNSNKSDSELSNYLYETIKELNLVDEVYKVGIDKQFIKDCINDKYILIKNN